MGVPMDISCFVIGQLLKKSDKLFLLENLAITCEIIYGLVCVIPVEICE